MEANVLHASPFSPPRSTLRLVSVNGPLSFVFLNNLALRSFHRFRRLPNPRSKVIGGLNLSSGISEGENGDILWETCFTRTLPPALTLQQGLGKMKEAVEKLKLNPPRTSSGICRFQVAVPPSVKALDWFFCQPVSSEVFPQFFLSKEMENPVCKSLYLNGIRGVFGIGTAAYIACSSSITREWSLFKIKTYLSDDSTFIKAYLIMGSDLYEEPSSLTHESGSLYLFIPQIELDECRDMSILTSTLAWNESSHYAFEGAVYSYELSLEQASSHFSQIAEKCRNKCRTSTLRNFNMVEDKNVKMVYLNALSVSAREKKDIITDSLELNDAFYSRQFCIRLSPTIAVSSNMLDCSRVLSYNEKHYANINTVWASLIIEECCRLGLTYFCVAPGSRSSPLAVAASTHPLTTCMSCFDERSLAFHAIGYARGSHKPAVVITSSGTAVSNLLPAVVEASQDFVPILLLTADRPPELQEAGANQAINQVNHFGSFVRFFFSLPPPTDHIPARMVLTTLDSALYWATSSPSGPVHINCPFREPLESSPRKWMLNCLEGLDFWMSSDEPFTKYIQVQNSHACNDTQYQMAEVLEVIQRASQGLLLFGALRTEDEMWAALLIAKHLRWPVVADILSGLRLRKLLISFHEVEENFLFVDYLDHVLLSELVRNKAHADVIIQVASEISFQIHSENSLTEPHVAHVISEGLCSDSALFIGNSMAIRDADMYGCNWVRCTYDTDATLFSSEQKCHWIDVAGNRGVSGIDGLLSTAIGFAVGCQKRVLCVIGDVSFLHDTNGLAIFGHRMWRKPMTVLVINNHGGAIFSLLPVANRTDATILNQYFYTSHNISVRKLCNAHGVKHLHVRTKVELQDALFSSQQRETDCVIEVESCIDANASFHSKLRKFACQAADHAMSLFSRLSLPDSAVFSFLHFEVSRLEYSEYRILLSAPPTSISINNDPTKFYREGFILTLSLEDGGVGFGEVAPLEIYKENFFEVEAQLQFLVHAIKGVKISYLLPLLRGSFSSWIWSSLGVPPYSIFPSVRCGLEMAILNAIALRQGSNLLNMLHPHMDKEEEICERSSKVQICALIDASGTPAEVAYIARRLVKEGFAAIKLKVARRAEPIEDAAVVEEVRKKVGHEIELRADANRKWTYKEAIQFGACVKNCGLQYIEEPVQNEGDIIKFCEETGLPVALDETIDCIKDHPLKTLAKFTHPRVVAVVIKPSVVGGFENASLIARWAQQQRKMVVVSAAFESSLGLSAYIQLACYFELQNVKTCRMMKRELAPSVAHGFGTYRWLQEDVTTETLEISRNPNSGFVEASVANAARLLQNFQINCNNISRTFSGEQIRAYQLTVEYEGLSCFFNMQEIGPCTNNNVLVFLHGFLGTGEDWIPIMKALSGSARCISIDLPGHGGTKIQSQASNKAAPELNLSIEVIASVLFELFNHITPGRVTLVGYSMGARITLYMTLRFSYKIEGAVIISGSPGLKELAARKIRRARDDRKARSLITYGLEHFMDTWYAGELWKSLRGHPHFDQIAARRLQHGDVHTLAKVLSDLSIGRQPPMWEDLKQCQLPLMIIVGERDWKFKRIAQAMCHEIGYGTKSTDDLGQKLYEMVEVPNCGHAVHLENPLHVISTLRKFFMRLN
ncbi:protein PHYLLO, chloroplastic isoform X2 [Malania oleifera]|uniref:protein PHYLLO, chloroplastic isoform X2 n=1 Tax=Malania oleifera TaxID=397392 RepID=UPI0025AE827D|nr:protein PHYLLO, chloroplastic isoform X2 [Malania oleifera]